MYERNIRGYDRDDSFRTKFGLIIFSLVVLVVIVLLASSLILIMGFGEQENDLEATYYVFGAILPLIGTWLGILLAFYFSGENFKSANRSLYNMIDRVSLLRKGLSIPVTAKMLPLWNMIIHQISPEKSLDSIKIKRDILDRLEEKNINRLPILDHQHRPKYIIHKSTLDKFLLEKAFQENISTEVLNNFSLEKLVTENRELQKLFEDSYATINPDTTLEEAKARMDSLPNCRDIFITKNGKKNEPLIGWLTDVIIWKCL